MSDSGPDVLSCRRGLPTWEARRLIRNTPRPGGEPWRTAVGAVSLRSTFFSFSSLFLSWWPIGSWRRGPMFHVGVLHGIDQPWSRSAIISRGSSVTQRGHWRVSTAPLHHRARGPCQPKAVARSRPPKWHPPPPRPGLQGTASKLAALAALANNNTLRPALHTRRDASGPSQRWDWPIAATASRACPRTPSFTRRARFPSSP